VAKKKQTALIYLAEIDNLKGQLEAALRDKAAAVEEEREACAKVGDDRMAEIEDLIKDLTPDTYIYDKSVSQMDECELITDRIRSRSKS
jgi:hypothetical protein